MATRIPEKIKKQALDSWFFGIPRDMIALSIGCSNGSITRIIASWKSTTVPDIDLLRAIAVMIRREGLNLDDVASGIRIKNFLYQMGSSEKDMEQLLEDIEIHSFKSGQTFNDFLLKIHEVHNFASNLGISIHKVFEYINSLENKIDAKKKELSELEKLILRKQIEYRSMR